MGFLDFDDREDRRAMRHEARIKSALAGRGLIPDFDDCEWEIHGPHQDMDYQVLIGWAHDGADNWACVAIYPRAVYKIDDPGDWWKCEERIPVN
jgi:hypothetical protein